MPKQTSEATKQYWRAKIEEQRLSSLSTTAWCKQNEIVVHTFYYWRDKLLEPPIYRADFKEISDREIHDKQTGKLGICLTYREVSIQLSKQFDKEALKQCLKAIKEFSC